MDTINHKELTDFFSYLLNKTYQYQKINFDQKILEQSFNDSLSDVRYHYPSTNETILWEKIITNSNELAIWLYRIGRNIWKVNNCAPILKNLHWLLKELCSCEIYFSSSISNGFYVFHGEGLVIGSRNIIGEGLRVYQNVTIGHKTTESTGAKIGNNVRIYSGAKVIGSIAVGDNVIIGANTVLTKSIESDKLVYGNPNIISTLKKSNLI